MEANFKACLALIRSDDIEGGNDDDPHDHGGRTSRGITQAEYNAYRQHKKQPIKDVWKAEEIEINEIYYISYWQPWCGQLPDGVDLIVFNMNVNAGPVRSVKLLQKALGVVPDGHFGIITLTAVNRAKPRILIPSWAIETRNWYRSLHQARFIKGWLKRTNIIEREALRLVHPTS